jgi:hypothetical protein
MSAPVPAAGLFPLLAFALAATAAMRRKRRIKG